MLSLHTNAAALSSQNAVGNTQKSLTTSLTRLGTGFRVNSAMDDAAGLQIATRLDAQTRGMAVAQRNTQNGISMMQTAEGAFQELTNVLLRMKDLATEAFNASSTTEDVEALQAEFDALGSEVANIFKSTSFGGSTLFTADGTALPAAGASDGLLGTAGGITFQIGASENETMVVDTATDLATLGDDLAAVSSFYATTAPATAGTELSGANTIITTINDAIASVGTVRAKLGAASNRLDHVYNNLGNMITNTTASKGRIMDVDYALETSNSTSKQLLLQAGTSALKQSSSLSQLVMSLMQ
ncbi:flagellin N-terminal helical domain-containing protein [Peristeroidobacter soli]|jgi:flagellin|uniref:flagellin N-terminal helical domain-containing protein n=1 Tax=Peristeroidobacter soli TaxID=2497877 RepID=UPI00101E1B62|nr:flagellin [Peristeroidobacter soli]